MSYESKCIRDVINDDLNKVTFLPAIQREFVWEPNEIEKLFDSLMGDYPISSFLFWKIKEENKKDWTSYEFIRDFDKENPHNNEADLSGINKDVYLVLDGQQRLTSLLVGLRGSYRYFYYRWWKTKLYLNLLKPPVRNEDNPEELTYEFKFRESSKTESSEKELWYRVGKILDYLDAEDAKDDLNKRLNGCGEKEKNVARKLVGHLHSRIHTYKLINYYEEKSQDYDKVVEVFIRANTGGKKLDYSDILLSTATAKWKDLNAREEIQTFTDDINKIGNGYNFEKDFILKGSLYLTDPLPIQYKVKNFTKHNLSLIENNWTAIKTNIEKTIRLIDKYGFNQKNVTSSAALLPVSFYLLKHNSKNFVDSSNAADVKNQNTIQKWIILSLLKNAFGSSSDTVLKNLRDVLLLQSSYNIFPALDLLKKLGIEPSFTDTELNNIEKISYKTKYSYLILSLLYPDRDWKDKSYHEDHIFPKSEFTSAKLRGRKYSSTKIEEYQKYYNSILNLQLLTSSENLEKNSKDFSSWITSRDANFKKRHTIPELKSYSFDNFISFISERRKLIFEKLNKIKVV
jgi:uncharacterized protein with ParB-like and HNH nuclease domain